MPVWEERKAAYCLVPVSEKAGLSEETVADDSENVGEDQRPSLECWEGLCMRQALSQ